MTGQVATEPISATSMWSQIRGEPVRVFLLCLAGYSLVRMNEGLWFYATPSVAADFGVSQKTVGFVISASSAIGIIGSTLVGSLADVLGRQRMFGVTIVGSGLFVALQALAPSVGWLIGLRALGHSFISSMSPIKTTILTEVSPARYRGILTGFLQAGSPFGSGLASVIAILAIDPHGWRWGFLSALLVIPPGLILWRMLGETQRFEKIKKPETRNQKPETDNQRPATSDQRPATGHQPELPATSDQRRAAGHQRPLSWLTSIGRQMAELFGSEYRRIAVIGMAAAFLFGGAAAGSLFFWKPYLQQVKGLAPVEASTIVGISWGVGIGGYFLAAIVGEFLLPRRDTFAIWVVLGVATLLSTVWLAQTYLALAVCFALMGVFLFGAVTVFATLIAESFPTRIRATGATVVASTGLDLGFIVFPVLTSTAAEDWMGWNLMFSTLIAIPYLMAAGLFLLLPRIKSGLEVEEVVKEITQ